LTAKRWGTATSSAEARGLTQQEVAERLQMARTTLTAIEKGERLIRPDELITLAQLYQESVHRLLRQETKPESLFVQFRSTLSGEWSTSGTSDC
jgi:transcriptional regulator with XRE-family HTH domain